MDMDCTIVNSNCESNSNGHSILKDACLNNNMINEDNDITIETNTADTMKMSGKEISNIDSNSLGADAAQCCEIHPQKSDITMTDANSSNNISHNSGNSNNTHYVSSRRPSLRESLYYKLRCGKWDALLSNPNDPIVK